MLHQLSDFGTESNYLVCPISTPCTRAKISFLNERMPEGAEVTTHANRSRIHSSGQFRLTKQVQQFPLSPTNARSRRTYTQNRRGSTMSTASNSEKTTKGAQSVDGRLFSTKLNIKGKVQGAFYR